MTKWTVTAFEKIGEEEGEDVVVEAKDAFKKNLQLQLIHFGTVELHREEPGTNSLT